MSKNAKHAKPAKSAKPAQTSDEFISDDAISTGSASYMKLEKTNTIRMISKPVIGWLEWIDKKPIRTSIADGEPEASDEENPPKKFMAVVIIDRKDDEVKIMELTQQSVIKAIKALASNPAWGNPFSYDINITKSGEGMKTKYVVTPNPKKPLAKDVIAAAEEKKCNLEALFAGEDPWKVDEADSITEYFYK